MVKIIDIILGPMFSGKTSKILQIIKYSKQNPNNLVITIKPDIDNRYEEDLNKHHVISHDGIKEECFVVNELNKIIKIVNNEISKINNPIDDLIIVIDESQFFKNLLEFCNKIFNTSNTFNIKNIKLVFSGLDGDFENKPIGEILSLVPICDSIIKLNGKCKYCDNNSIMSKRTCQSKSQVLIGGNDLYQPTCREHH